MLVFSAESIEVIKCEKPFFTDINPELISLENDLGSASELRLLDCDVCCCVCDFGTATEEDEGVSTDTTPDVDDVVGTL